MNLNQETVNDSFKEVAKELIPKSIPWTFARSAIKKLSRDTQDFLKAIMPDSRITLAL
jgi:hypothetical protein